MKGLIANSFQQFYKFEKSDLVIGIGLQLFGKASLSDSARDTSES